MSCNGSITFCAIVLDATKLMLRRCLKDAGSSEISTNESSRKTLLSRSCCAFRSAASWCGFVPMRRMPVDLRVKEVVGANLDIMSDGTGRKGAYGNCCT